MRSALYILSIMLLCTIVTLAQTPRTISYQGVLADASGNLVADGNHSLTIRLYEQASGGAAIYEESQSVVVTKAVLPIWINRSSSNGRLAIRASNLFPGGWRYADRPLPVHR